jgi:hypothetical protein
LVRGFKLGKAAAGRSTRQAESGGLASDQGILNYVFVLFCYEIIMVKLFISVMKLLFVDKFICVCAEFIRNY